MRFTWFSVRSNRWRTVAYRHPQCRRRPPQPPARAEHKWGYLAIRLIIRVDRVSQSCKENMFVSTYCIFSTLLSTDEVPFESNVRSHAVRAYLAYARRMPFLRRLSQFLFSNLSLPRANLGLRTKRVSLEWWHGGRTVGSLLISSWRFSIGLSLWVYMWKPTIY